MKKILLSLTMVLAIVALASCSLNSKTTIEFSKLPETVYEAGDYSNEEVKALLEKVSVKVSGVANEIDLTNNLLTVSGFDAATLKTPGTYNLVVIYGSASVVFSYTVVAKVEPQKVSTADQLQAALDKGGIIELQADILNVTKQFEITESVAIYGNGYTISATSGATRVFNLSEVSNIHVQIYNLKMISAGQRGISLYLTTDVELTLNDCQVSAASYAINLASGNNGTVVTINNSYVVAWAALNIWANTATVNVNDSVLEGINNYSSISNDFGTIVLNGGHYDYENVGLKAGDTGQDNVLNFKNSQIIATQNGTNLQHALLIQGACVGNTISFDNCEVVCEEGSLYLPDDFYPTSNVFTIDGVRK